MDRPVNRGKGDPLPQQVSSECIQGARACVGAGGLVVGQREVSVLWELMASVMMIDVKRMLMLRGFPRSNTLQSRKLCPESEVSLPVVPENVGWD